MCAPRVFKTYANKSLFKEIDELWQPTAHLNRFRHRLVSCRLPDRAADRRRRRTFTITDRIASILKYFVLLVLAVTFLLPFYWDDFISRQDRYDGLYGTSRLVSCAATVE